MSVTGFINNATLAVDKFDPTLGTLTRVELDFVSHITGTVCLDNDLEDCCSFVNYEARAVVTVAEAPSNDPQVMIGPLGFENVVGETLIELAADEGDGPGNFNCSGTVEGCDGDDSIVKTYSSTDSLGAISLTTDGEVRPFIQCAGQPDQVAFVAGLVWQNTAGGCGPMDFSFDPKANVRVDVNYFYCDNAPPVCAGDTAQTMENMPVDIDVLENDFDPEDRLDCDSIQFVQLPMNGAVSLVGCVDPPDDECPPGPSNCKGCVVRYEPKLDTCGPDSFSYRVFDLDGGMSDVCTVTIDVAPVNEPPVAVNDTATTPEDTPVVIDVCLNDFDPDAAKGCGADKDCCTILITSQPDCGGTAMETTACRARFIPPPGFCGECTFRYTIQDTEGLVSNEATVTVTVLAVNDCPIAVDDTASTPEDTPVLIPVCMNDSDPDLPGCGGPIDCCTVVVTSPPDCGGTTSVSCDGVLFTPPQDFCGTCTFRYTVSDTEGCVSNEATVTVEVTPVNDCPVAVNDTETTPEDTPVLVRVCDNDTDPDANGCGEPIDCCTVTVTMEPDCGGTTEVTCDGVIFTPPPGFCGTCSFRYQVSDGANCTSNVALVTVEVTPVNDCPVANPDTGETMEGVRVTIDVCANDTDADEGTACGAPIDCCTVMIVTPPSCGGKTEVTCDGVTFTPPDGFCGTCTFGYTVSDGAGCVSNPATVTVEVIGENSCPTANPDTATTPEDTPVTIPVCDNDTDPDEGTGCGEEIDCCTVMVVTEPGCGGTTTTTCGGVRFNPPPGFCGTCNFTYTVEDGAGCVSNVATVTVTVTAGNDPPVANDDEAKTQQNMPVVIDLCANDTDPDQPSGCGAPLDCTSIVIVSQPDCGGSVTSNGDGTATFVPPLDVCGIDCTFTYRVSDTAGLTDTAVVRVRVNCIECQINRRVPGSLLLYPEFDNRDGIVTTLSLTNRAQNGSPDIRAKFVYRDEFECGKFDRSEVLTPNDTITLITNFHNPQMDRGYVYVYAECETGSVPVVFNHLFGNLLVVDGLETFSFAVNPVSFEGIGEGGAPACNGLIRTDVDNDGIRDLNGIEYVQAPDEILVPRFMGQTDEFRSELILIGLTGVAFDTTLDFLIYDDNEHAFSKEYTFGCWARVPLLDISNAFSQQFLETLPDTDPEEILGEPEREAGWFRIDGDVASSTSTTIQDPAFYAVLVESVGEGRYVGDLPFELCSQDNGDLLPDNIGGDIHD